VSSLAAAPLSAAESRGWRQALGAWLRAHKTYPEELQRRGEEGRVTVRFKVQRDGSIADVAILGPSGHPGLDQAAIALLRGARVPAFPPGMDQADATVTLGINYALER
jgi:protein TonB